MRTHKQQMTARLRAVILGTFLASGVAVAAGVWTCTCGMSGARTASAACAGMGAWVDSFVSWAAGAPLTGTAAAMGALVGLLLPAAQ